MSGDEQWKFHTFLPPPTHGLTNVHYSLLIRSLRAVSAFQTLTQSSTKIEIYFVILFHFSITLTRRAAVMVKLHLKKSANLVQKRKSQLSMTFTSPVN